MAAAPTLINKWHLKAGPRVFRAVFLNSHQAPSSTISWIYFKSWKWVEERERGKTKYISSPFWETRVKFPFSWRNLTHASIWNSSLTSSVMIPWLPGLSVTFKTVIAIVYVHPLGPHSILVTTVWICVSHNCQFLEETEFYSSLFA